MKGIERIYEAQQEKLLQEFEQAMAISHVASRGKTVEKALASFLAERMPMRYGIGNGQIASHYGETSAETDIFVYDALGHHPLVAQEGYHLTPIERTYAVIQVTSNLTKRKLLEDAEKIDSAKRLVLPNQMGRIDLGYQVVRGRVPVPYGVLFAYGARGAQLRTVEAWLKQAAEGLPPERRVDLVCVLDKGLVSWRSEISEMEIFRCIDARTDDSPIALEHGTETLLEFMLRLATALERRHLCDGSLWRYYKGEFRRVGDHVVQFDIVLDCRHCREGVEWYETIKSEQIEALVKHEDCVRMDNRSAMEALLGNRILAPEQFARERDVYVYDPEGYLQKGFPISSHDVPDGPGGTRTIHGAWHSWFNMYIDDDALLIPACYVTRLLGECPHCGKSASDET